MVAGEGLARDTVAVVLAGGKGTRRGPLARDECNSALPLGGAYQSIDFALSNCVNSHIRRIGIVTQSNAESLLHHVNKVWSRIDRRTGDFVEVWPAETRAPVVAYRGTADAVFRNLELLERQQKGLVLVLDGDHFYEMDYRPMLEFHRRRQADVTIGCIEVPATEARRFGSVSADWRGRVERFVEETKAPDDLSDGGRVMASMGIYVFETPFLARVLLRDAFSHQSQHDFDGDIFPSLVGESKLFACPFVGPDGYESAYWRDAGTPMLTQCHA